MVSKIDTVTCPVCGKIHEIKHIWWAWALKNSVAIACWTILAIYFNKWWIALFAALFLSSVSTKNGKDDEDGN